ncbi:MAG: DUF481 domain-containing protein [Georgfuchsia sp.]
MLTCRHLLLLPLVFSVFLPAPSIADTVVVSSGERLGGKILHKGKNTLTLQTDYAGKIKIQWDKIVSITTDEPVIIQLDGVDQPLKAILNDGGDSDRIALAHYDDKTEMREVKNIPLAHILYINPNPDETPNGIAYKGRVNLALTNTSGNSSSSSLLAETEFKARARSFRYGINARGSRGETSGEVTSSNWLVAGNYDHFLDPGHFLYGRASVERDIFKDIGQRYVVGGGYGLQLIDRERTQLSVRSGLDYVVTNHISDGSEGNPSLGWGVKFTHRLEAYPVEVFHDQDGFLNVNDTNEITLRTRSGLRVPLMAGLTATSQINVDWEHQPAPGRKSTDSVLLLGLGYEW